MIQVKNRVCPYEAYETEKVEMWLNEMAQKGYALRRIGLYLTEFEEKESCEEKYIVGPYDKDDEFLQSYFENTYRLVFVTKLAKRMAVYRYTDLSEEEEEEIRNRTVSLAKNWAKDNGIYSSILVIAYIVPLAIALCQFSFYAYEGLTGSTAYEYENAVILVPLFLLVVYGLILVIHKSRLAYKVIKGTEDNRKSERFKIFRLAIKYMLPVVVALAVVGLLAMEAVYSVF